MARAKRVINENEEKTLPLRVERAAESVSNALDKVIHERIRLGIISALAGCASLSFNDLKGILGSSDGNISVHARKLEEAGYIAMKKSFSGRIPLTEYRITEAGREALARYLNHMEALINAMKAQS
ncbi:MAG TPA: transcriptional regulator [Blastocatellia bacterium]|nr:transcriptional regulator [Blastocatellia bacterium]